MGAIRKKIYKILFYIDLLLVFFEFFKSSYSILFFNMMFLLLFEILYALYKHWSLLSARNFIISVKIETFFDKHRVLLHGVFKCIYVVLFLDRLFSNTIINFKTLIFFIKILKHLIISLDPVALLFLICIIIVCVYFLFDSGGSDGGV